MKTHSKQAGAVMITVLILLVVVTIMGLASLKQGVYQTQMGTAAVAYNTCFVTAESGLNAVYKGFQKQTKENITISHEDNMMNKSTVSAQSACLGESGLDVDLERCPALDEFVPVTVTMLSRQADSDDASESSFRIKEGTDVDKGGNLILYTESRCELEGANLAVTNTQEWQHELQTSASIREYAD